MKLEDLVMIKVLAKNDKKMVIAVDYCFFGVNKKKNTSFPIEYLATTLRWYYPLEYGDFTDDYSKDFLEKLYKENISYVNKYKKELVLLGLKKEKVEPYLNKRYEQILAGLNEYTSHKFYKGVESDPEWDDDYQGLYLAI